MIALTLAELAQALGGSLVLPEGVGDDTVVSGSVETDSRQVGAGAVFFALPGEETDGHLFAPAAVEAGAALVIAERAVDVTVPQLVVDGRRRRPRGHGATRRRNAYGPPDSCASSRSRARTERRPPRTCLRAVLDAEGPTVAPQGSFNNHVGAPISMLRVDEATEYLVVEMGASHEGEIARLVAIATPDISVVLKVGLAHAGEFGGVDAIQRAKSEIVRDLPATSIAVLNRDDSRVTAMAAQTAARVAWFGQSPDADVRADDIIATAAGTAFTLVADGASHPVQLRILGEHHVSNALATLAVARELGIPPQRAIPAIEAVPRAERWRMEVLDRGDGVTVINDAYNASPDSTAAAMKTLAQIVTPGQRSVAVLGEMAELGEFAQEEHDRLGRLAVRLNIGKLVVVGERARHIHLAAGLEGSWDGESVLVPDVEAAYDLLREELRPGDVVLVKSSKSAGLRFLGDRLGGVTDA